MAVRDNICSNKTCRNSHRSCWKACISAHRPGSSSSSTPANRPARSKKVSMIAATLSMPSWDIAPAASSGRSYRSILRRPPPLPDISCGPHCNRAASRLPKCCASHSMHRLLKYSGAKRILYIFESSHAIDYTAHTLEQLTLPDSEATFSDLYTIQYLQGGLLDQHTAICITTPDQLYDTFLREASQQRTKTDNIIQIRY